MAASAPRELRVAGQAATLLSYAWMIGVTFACVPALTAQTVRVSGSLPCAGRMELAGMGTSPSGAGAGSNVRVAIPNGEVGVRAVILSLRTNCSYVLTAEWTGPAGTSVKVLPGAASAAGGTGHLRSGALAATFTQPELGPGAPAVCVRGAAISRGGNDSTSDNAVLIEVPLEVPREVPDAAIVFTLNLTN